MFSASRAGARQLRRGASRVPSSCSNVIIQGGASRVAGNVTSTSGLRSLSIASSGFKNSSFVAPSGPQFVCVLRTRGYATASTSTRKPGRPKGSTTKTASKTKTKAKPKTKAKAKPKAKPKAVGRPKKKAVKKVLTPEQKTRSEKRELLAAALKEPKQLPATAYLVVNAELTQGGKGLDAKAASEKYKGLSTSEKERYDGIAASNKAANKRAYDTWIKTFTPLQIKEANNARNRLNRLHGKRVAKLVDDRQVKRPASAYILYYKERLASGDFSNMAATDSGRLAGSEWKNLPESEKKKYEDSAAEEKASYFEAVKDVYKKD